MSRIGEKLALLFALGVVALNFPVLGIFNRAAAVGGIPGLYLYLFGVWIAVIIAVLVLARGPWDTDE